MELYEEYIKIEEGYDCLSTDNAFCAYSVTGDEFFVAHCYVRNRKEGQSKVFFDQVSEKARELGAKYMIGNVDISEYNRDNYTHKLMTMVRYGFEIIAVNTNRVTIYKEL